MTRRNPQFTEQDLLLEKSFIDPYLAFVSLAPQFMSVNNSVSRGNLSNSFFTVHPDQCVNRIIRKKFGSKGTNEDVEMNNIGYPFSELYGWQVLVQINTTCVTSEFLLALMRISPLVFCDFRLCTGEQQSVSSVSVILMEMFLLNPHCSHFLRVVFKNDDLYQSGVVSGIQYSFSEPPSLSGYTGEIFDGVVESDSGLSTGKMGLKYYEKLLHKNCQLSSISNFGNVISTSVVTAHITPSTGGNQSTLLEITPSVRDTSREHSMEESNNVVTIFSQKFKDKLNVLFESLKLKGSWENTDNNLQVPETQTKIHLHYQLEQESIIDSNVIHIVHKNGLVDEHSYCHFFIAKRTERPYNFVLNFALSFFGHTTYSTLERPVFVLTKLYSKIEVIPTSSFISPRVYDDSTTSAVQNNNTNNSNNKDEPNTLTTTTTTTTTTSTTKSLATGSPTVTLSGKELNKKWFFDFGFLNYFMPGGNSKSSFTEEEGCNLSDTKEPPTKKRKLDQMKE